MLQWIISNPTRRLSQMCLASHWNLKEDTLNVKKGRNSSKQNIALGLEADVLKPKTSVWLKSVYSTPFRGKLMPVLCCEVVESLAATCGTSTQNIPVAMGRSSAN